MEERNSIIEQRRSAVQFTLSGLGWLLCTVTWLSIISFDPADAPSTAVWPNNEPARNLCGPVGAHLAHAGLHYLGMGVYPLLGLLTLGLFGVALRLRLNDLWLRWLGVMLTCSAVAALAAMYMPRPDVGVLPGPGGILGTAIEQYFVSLLQRAGATIILLAATAIGLMLAADEFVIALLRSAGWVGARSAPMLIRGGAVLVEAGSAVASGVAQASARLATAGAGLTPRAGIPQPAPTKRLARSAGARVDEPEEDDGDASELDQDDNAASRNAATQEPASRRSPTRAAAIEEEDEECEEDDAVEPSGPTPRATSAPNAPTGELWNEADAPIPVREHPSRLPVRKDPPVAPTPSDEDYELPNIDTLEDSTPIDRGAVESLCREKAFVLEQTLSEFRLDVRVVAIETGPVITVFELKLAPGIKVSQIASLSNDLARALKAPAVRVVAPLPGKNTIGLEVPNLDKEKVRLKDLLRAGGAQLFEHSAIPLYLGKDAAGQPLISDLAKMPHLLVAGTTGSGKSVCVSSIIMSVLLTRTPRQVQMILVDPKVVELAMFKDIPHLMCPIVTETSRAEAILDWAATKMDERYALLAEAGVKDIRSYNRLGEAGLRERLELASEEEFAKVPKFLPYIVIVIDELADLMMTSAKEVEFNLCRLAQKSRAVGIHLIVSTQRPQANVVTGLIKSNLPCRIAFRVSSRLDSRIVLDQNGGEVLMGQGDMLFLPPGAHKLVRAQGTYISDDELRSVVRHCRSQGEPQYSPELTRSPAADAASMERDELFDKAVDIILETGRGSVSLLQRRLNIGYGRASRLIDQMALAGIVGEYKGSQAREVIITREEWKATKAARDADESHEDEPA